MASGIFEAASHKVPRTGPLELIYVGRLVPYKACDLAIRGAASLLQQELARLTIVGDGPDRQGLEKLAGTLGVMKRVSFVGWLRHSEVIERVRESDVLVFPSVREFGGGVVFEALALGAVPVVADYGGPGDIVNSKVGFKVALTNEEDMIALIEKILTGLASDRALLGQLQQEGMRYAREHLSWDGKAQKVTQILLWVLGQGPKPDLNPPKTHYLKDM